MELHSKGLSNKAISRELGKSIHWVRKTLTELGLSSAFKRGINEVEPGVARCSKCGKLVSIADLPWNTNGSRGSYQYSKCKECHHAYVRAWQVSSPEQYLKTKQYSMKHRAKSNGWPYDLPDGYLWRLWQDQDGLCFYTDTPLTIPVGDGDKRNATSVDKIDPLAGYTTGNLVLCLNRINTIKNDCTLEEMREWMPEWHARLMSRLQIN